MDRNNFLWILKFDGQQFTFYTNQKNKLSSWESSNNIKIIESDKNGDIWIGVLGGGVIHFKTQEETFTYYTEKEGLCSNNIASLYEDSRGMIWVGSIDNGISKIVIDSAKVSFQNFNQKDGLSQNDVWTIHEDPKGNIWLGVDACLNLLFFENKKKRDKIISVTKFCDFNGQSSQEFFSNASLLDSEGQMWWGSSGDLLRVDANSIMPTTDAPKVFLDEIEINQAAIDFTELAQTKANHNDFWIGKNKDQNLAAISFSTIPSYFNYPLDLELPYDFNTITFRFAATDDPDLSEVKFSCFLKGNDRQWSKPSIENKIDYRNLSPGSYIFKVKATGKNAIWSKSFEYAFSITPPWWQTWYAYLIYIAILVGSLYWIYLFNLNRGLEQAETKRVKELDGLKTRLYTNITHEFRTPLTVIMGMNENVQGNEKAKKLIRRNSKNLIRLVNQLLDLSKLESGTMQMDQVQGDIVIYLQYLTESFHSMAEEKGIRLTFYSEVESLVMDYDEVKTQHIIYNLLSNAIKFTPSGGKVILHLSQIVEGGIEHLKLKFKDTGIGIPASKVPHIFDRFYQVDGSHTRKGEGTGIGLALTKELIQMMEGTIEVNSVEDKGTEFLVYLPVRRVADKIAEENYDELYFKEKAKEFVPSLANELSLGTPIADEKYQAEILLIEDNKDVVMYIEHLLKPNYKVHITNNGQRGIDAALDLVPDIIISDVMMPEKDGFEVCETLKQDARTSHIPIILLTAKAAQSDKVQGLQYGADAFLSKPFDKTELFIRIDKLIEIRRRLQEKYSGLIYGQAQMKTSNKVSEKPNIEDAFIQEIRKVVEQYYNNVDFGVGELAKAMLMSHTQVYRKLKALTGKTPSQFIRSIRLQKGKNLLLSSDLNISEIAYEIGFADPSYFSRTFQQEFSTSPREMRNLRF